MANQRTIKTVETLTEKDSASLLFELCADKGVRNQDC
jgi:hypothetical protein